jgi:KUP system potassium uptake protein
MRADNKGEGGILALLALVPPRAARAQARRSAMLAALVLFGAGAALRRRHDHPGHLGAGRDRGARGRRPSLALVVPITCAILVGLFSCQRGTAGIGRSSAR